jgi:CubicO group peptidase (beta-lactamase class C family)
MKPHEIIKCIMNAQLLSKPGSIFSYANATSILLGMVVERCSSLSLEVIAQKYLFGPLKMNSTSFYPERFCKECIVPTEVDSWRERTVQGEVHDESAWALRPMVVGSAGLFSTIVDLSNFLEMLVGNGSWKGTQIFQKETVLAMHTNQLPIENKKYTGLGWELNQPQTMGAVGDQNVFGKTGFTGCSIAVSPLKQAGYILLSNHLYPKRRENRDEINSVRRTLAEIVLN